MDIENVISWLLALLLMVGPFLIPVIIKAVKAKKKKEQRENRSNTQSEYKTVNDKPKSTTMMKMSEMFETLLEQTGNNKPKNIPEVNTLDETSVAQKTIEKEEYYKEYLDKINKDSDDFEVKEESIEGEGIAVLEDFDLRDAIIYSEIIRPKYF